MTKFILGKKIEMSQIFTKEGNAVPVTVIQAGPVKVTQIKTREKDGYEAVQVTFGRHKREFKPDEAMANGSLINVSVFKEGDKVKVSGLDKGRGFQGVVKRHGFHGASATHGTKHAHREPGSIGATWPQRVLKGTRMAGRMGGKRVTVRNLNVVKVDAERNLLYLEGAVPGSRNAFIEIKG